MDMMGLASLFGKDAPGMGFLQMLQQSMNPAMQGSAGPNSVADTGGQLQPLSLPPDPARSQLGKQIGAGLSAAGKSLIPGTSMNDSLQRMSNPMPQRPPPPQTGGMSPFQPMASQYQAPGSHLRQQDAGRFANPMMSPFQSMGGQ